MGYLRSHTNSSSLSTQYLEKQAFFGKMWEKVKTNLSNVGSAVKNVATGQGSLRDVGSMMTGGWMSASKPAANEGGGFWSRMWGATPAGMLMNTFKGGSSGGAHTGLNNGSATNL